MALLDAFRSRKWLRTATDLEDSSATTESKAFLDKVGLATLWAKIKSTFATKAEVEAKADASELDNYVDLTSAQSVSGIKTFSKSVKIAGAGNSSTMQEGLWVRGIHGVNTAATAKDSLYLNYDGNNNYSNKVYIGGNGTACVAVRRDMLTWSNITSKPTTIEGYGITDAKISDGTITLGANSITPITSHQSLSNYATKTDLAAKLDVSGTAAKATADASGNNIVNTYAKKASPELTGIPKAPTAAKGTNTTQIATTEFVQTAMADKMAMPSVVECNGNEVEDSPLVLTPDTAYICTFDEGYPTLYIESFPSKDNGDDASQYLRPCFIQFFVEYAETFGIDYPRGLLWANGEIPTFEDNTWYQMSVLNGCAVVTKFVAV